MSMTGDWKLWLDAAREAAWQAAEVLQHWRAHFSVREKAPNDLVTEADLAAQETIRRILHHRLPSIAFLGEESPGTPGLASDLCWVVDPLDGTTNYVHGLPCYAISIGLIQRGMPVLGVIHDPLRQETFSAVRGQGAWLDGIPIRVSNCHHLQDALLVTGFPTDCRGKEYVFAAWRALALRSQAVRRIGCTSLNLAWLAAGRADGCWSYEIHPWDVCAGICLVEQAGGRVSTPDGLPYTLDHRDFVASNGSIHNAILEVLRECGGWHDKAT